MIVNKQARPNRRCQLSNVPQPLVMCLPSWSTHPRQSYLAQDSHRAQLRALRIVPTWAESSGPTEITPPHTFLRRHWCFVVFFEAKLSDYEDRSAGLVVQSEYHANLPKFVCLFVWFIRRALTWRHARAKLLWVLRLVLFRILKTDNARKW
jgi:hypothetical protein